MISDKDFQIVLLSFIRDWYNIKHQELRLHGAQLGDPLLAYLKEKEEAIYSVIKSLNDQGGK